MNAKELENKVTDLLRKWGFLPPKLAPRPIPVHPRPRSPSRQRY